MEYAPRGCELEMTTPHFYAPNELAPGEVREPEVNGRGQFRIKCPDGKARWYTRCTTFIGSLEDESAIVAWKRRVDLIGLQVDWAASTHEYTDTLWDELQQADPLDKDALNEIVERAFVAGDGYLKAQKGTDLHRLCELWDTGQPLPELSKPDEADLSFYLDACDKWGLLHLDGFREQRVVHDEFKVTGTPDSIVNYKCLDGVRRNVIFDLKTGRVDYGRGKMAQQLAMYAASETYTDDGSPTGARAPLPDVSRDVGLILHLPQGEAQNGVEPRLYEVDLRMGWYGIMQSRRVREWRNISKRTFHEVP